MKSGNRFTWQRFFYSPVGIFFGLIVFVLLLRGGWNIHQKALLAQQRLDQAQTELTDLQHQQVTLTSSISQLSTNEGVEAALREKYHAVKQGESVAVIIDNSKPDTENTTSGGVSSDSNISSSTSYLSWWGRLVQFIGF